MRTIKILASVSIVHYGRACGVEIEAPTASFEFPQGRETPQGATVRFPARWVVLGGRLLIAEREQGPCRMGSRWPGLEVSWGGESEAGGWRLTVEPPT